jgi:hypothetical protein
MRKLPALLLLAAVGIAGCGGSSSSSSGSTSSGSAATSTSATSAAAATTSSGGVNPNQRETLPPGDIPDTIAYVPYAVPGAKLTVSTPEGWSRATTPGRVTFTDKLNTIQVLSTSATAPVTVASAQSTEVPKLASSAKGFKLQSVTVVQRPAGPAVRIAYLADSQPNPVTGKVGTLAFERYDFFDKSREVSLVLSAPLGSDNVDPWRKVTTSLRFTG